MKKLLIVPAFILIGVGVRLWLEQRESRHAAEKYTLTPVDWGALTETVSATGAVQPLDVVAVGTPLSGQVVQLFPAAEVNAVVREGDPLLRLDDRLAREKVAQAEAAVRSARADVERAKAQRDAADLALAHERHSFERDLLPHWQVDKTEIEAKAALATVHAAEARQAEAEAALSQARTGLDFTTVRVPYEGGAAGPASGKAYTVLERKVVRGQLVGPPASAQLFTLCRDLSRVRVVALVSEDDVGKLRTGLAADFTVYAHPGPADHFAGRLSEVRPMPERQHGLVFYEALIDADNRRDPKSNEWMIRPGMTASVTFTLRGRPGWRMPVQALEFEPAGRELTDAARAKLARWDDRPDRNQWRAAWVLGPDRKPWPVFARVGGVGPDGDPGIADGRFAEVLEWDPELEPRPAADDPATFPRAITGGGAKEAGTRQQPTAKVF